MIRYRLKCQTHAFVLPGLLMLACALGSGCQPANPKLSATTVAPKAGSAPAGPSRVVGGIKEADLTRVELTEDAEKRLGIVEAAGGLATVERKAVPRA